MVRYEKGGSEQDLDSKSLGILLCELVWSGANKKMTLRGYRLVDSRYSTKTLVKWLREFYLISPFANRTTRAAQREPFGRIVWDGGSVDKYCVAE
jgi:hypothetical protein